MAKYGGSYLCAFVDNDARVLNKLLPNRSKHTLSSHLEKIPLEERKRVLYVTIDMWEPYKQVSLKYFPNCTISVDPFHVVKHLSDGFTKLRVSLMNQDTIVSFKESKLECYSEFIKLLENWLEEICNSFQRPTDNRKQSNAPAESLNQKM